MTVKLLQHRLIIFRANEEPLGFGPYPEYPITELEVDAKSGGIKAFAWKSPNVAAGETGVTLAYVRLDSVDVVAVETTEVEVPDGRA